MRHFVLVLALSATACLSASAIDDTPARVRDRVADRVEMNAIADRLFCGRLTAEGSEVTDGDIQLFLEEVVTPRFPEGFTVWDARGMWRGGHERTMVLEIVYPDSAASASAMKEIADEYRRRFRQHSVARVRTPARFELVTE